MRSKRWQALLALTASVLVALIGTTALTQGQQKAREEMVPMRDGVKLAVSIYLPATGPGPWPVVLSRTPYGKDNGAGIFSDREKAFLAKGFVRVVQDARGKFKSEGSYVPFDHDIEDGYDTIEW